MTCWFFLSYARLDNDLREGELVREFFDDLRRAVVQRVRDPEADAFFDEASVPMASRWSPEVARGIRECRVFVPVMTGPYFTRKACGAEWAAFELRCRRAQNNGEPLPLILPIPWVRPYEDFPAYAKAIQLTFDRREAPEPDREFVQDYIDEGMLHLAKRREGSHKGAYETIIERLAGRIVELAHDHPLPALPEDALPTLDQIEPKFGKPGAPPAGPEAANNRACFAVVAGSVDDMTGLRDNSRDIYKANGLDWCPYAPGSSESIAILAQRAATDRSLRVEWVPVDDRLAQKLQDVERQGTVSILVVDPWAAKVRKYAQCLESFDAVQLANCAVVVVWNDDDATTEQREAIQETLRTVLRRKFIHRGWLFRSDKVRDIDALRSELGQAIEDLERVMATHREPARHTDSGSRRRRPSLTSTEPGS